jgi:uncharacterized membrane protein YqjE
MEVALHTNEWKVLERSFNTLLEQHDAIVTQINLHTRKVMFVALALCLILASMVILSVLTFFDPVYIWALAATTVLGMVVSIVSVPYLKSISTTQDSLFCDSSDILAAAKDTLQRMQSMA